MDGYLRMFQTMPGGDLQFIVDPADLVYLDESMHTSTASRGTLHHQDGDRHELQSSDAMPRPSHGNSSSAAIIYWDINADIQMNGVYIGHQADGHVPVQVDTCSESYGVRFVADSSNSSGCSKTFVVNMLQSMLFQSGTRGVCTSLFPVTTAELNTLMCLHGVDIDMSADMDT